jgi:hypothetical protein
MQTAAQFDARISEREMPFTISDTSVFLCHIIEQKKGPVADATEPWNIAMLVAISRWILL